MLIRASKRSLAAAALVLPLIAGTALAGPVEDDLRARSAALSAWRDGATQVEMQNPVPAIAEHFGDVDISSLTARQIEIISEPVSGHPELRGAAIERLGALEDPETVEGTAAIVLGEVLSMYENRKVPGPERIVELLELPMLKQTLDDGSGYAVFMIVQLASRMTPVEVQSIKDDVIAANTLISDAMPPRSALASAGYYMAVEPLLQEDPATKEEIRARMAGALRAAQPRIGEGEADLAEYLEEAIATFDGAYARGELVDHEAPNIDFLWTSNGAWSSLSELKGKVVVLDFWATWCGPCVGSFPLVRDLQTRYAESDVLIVGVTSLQGQHIVDLKLRETVDTTGEPEKEFALMADYIKANDVSWHVAFGKQNVFNPEYGVTGIPHVVILDPKGVVRYREVRGHDRQIELIDGLLEEFDLAKPAD